MSCNTQQKNASSSEFSVQTELFSQEELNAKLWQAVDAGNLKRAIYLVGLKAALNQTNKEGMGLAHLTAINGWLAGLKWLDNNGVDLEGKDNNRNTPAHLAAVQGHRGVIDYLLNEGYDVTSKNASGQTPQALAAGCEHTKTERVLKLAAANPKTVALHVENALYDRIVQTGVKAFYTDNGAVNRNMIKKVKRMPTQKIFTALLICGVLQHTQIEKRIKKVFAPQIINATHNYK